MFTSVNHMWCVDTNICLVCGSNAISGRNTCTGKCLFDEARLHLVVLAQVLLDATPNEIPVKV